MNARKLLAGFWLGVLFFGGAVAFPIAFMHPMAWWAAILFVWGFVAVLVAFAYSIALAIEALGW